MNRNESRMVLADASHALDLLFVSLQNDEFSVVDSKLEAKALELEEEFKGDIFSVIEIRRARLERLLVAAIQRNLPVSRCMSFFQERANLGFNDVVGKWLITHFVCGYFIECGRKQDVMALLEAMRRELVQAGVGCSDSLEQVKRMIDEIKEE